MYALPTAGVLAIELLQDSQTGRQSAEPLPRSEIIQNLSRLVETLRRFVPPEDGNFALCDQARRVIWRILDKVLSMPAGPFNSNVNASSSLTTMDQIDGPITPGIELSWLASARSELDFWESLPEHPLLTSQKG